MLKTSIRDYETLSMVTFPFYFINWRSIIKQTVCKVLEIFQCSKFLIPYVLNAELLRIGYLKLGIHLTLDICDLHFDAGVF